MSGTTFKRGDLALVPYPFSDLSATKRRPVLVLSDPDVYGDFLAMAVTSKSHHAQSVAIDQSAIVKGHLPAASWIRIDRIVTLNAALIVKVFGTVTDAFVLGAIRAMCYRVGYRP